MIVDFQAQFVFVHIPKTGGSSIRKCLSAGKDALLHDLIRRPTSNTTKHETYCEFLDQFPARTGLNRQDAKTLTPIAFVRDPVTRFLSLHRYLRRTQSSDESWVNADVDEWVSVVAANEKSYLGNIRGLRPQSDFIAGFGSDGFIGRFENLTADFDVLAKRYNLPVTLPHLNASPKQGQSTLSKTSLRTLRDLYAADFENFGYAL